LQKKKNNTKSAAAKEAAAEKKTGTKKTKAAVKETAAVQKTKKNKAPKPPKKSDKIKVIPLGGLDQIGMNMTAFEYEDTIIVVDCGMAFADDTLLGIDLIIPDITYLKQNRKKVKAFFVSHGHEDHIGGIPYFLKQFNTPIYGTKLTIGLIKK